VQLWVALGKSSRIVPAATHADTPPAGNTADPAAAAMCAAGFPWWGVKCVAVRTSSHKQLLLLQVHCCCYEFFELLSAGDKVHAGWGWQGLQLAARVEGVTCNRVQQKAHELSPQLRQAAASGSWGFCCSVCAKHINVNVAAVINGRLGGGVNCPETQPEELGCNSS
jgi:hypothetical protein